MWSFVSFWAGPGSSLAPAALVFLFTGNQLQLFTLGPICLLPLALLGLLYVRMALTSAPEPRFVRMLSGSDLSCWDSASTVCKRCWVSGS